MKEETAEDVVKIKDISRPEPINRESRFEYDELFFSITDEKSTIKYANDIFVRISKYEQQSIVGQLHKLIRHPDMPRSIFYVFWDYLKKNKPVAAYVKNMAKDGSYYWVMALAFPCDGGYLSVRLKPGGELFLRVKKLYERVLNHEKEQEKQTDKKTAMHSAHEYLLAELKKMGYSDYDEFMWSALQDEMENRETELSKNSADTSQHKEHIPTELLDLESLLRELVLTLGDLKQIHESLVGHSEYILKLSRSVLLLSKNAQVSSAKLDSQDRSLSVVAEKMGEQSITGEKQLLSMQDNIFQLSDLIGTLSFDIVSSKLQAEMTRYFLDELEDEDIISNQQILSEEKTLTLLYSAFVPKIDSISEGISRLPGFLKKLLDGVREIERFLLVLRFVHIKGKVEIARMNDEAKSFSNTFEELIKEVDAAETRLEKLGDIIRRHENTGRMFAAKKDELSGLGNKIKAFRTEQQKEAAEFVPKKNEVAA